MTGADILFEVIYRGEPEIVTNVRGAEIESLIGTVGPPQDMLEFWSLIAIRSGAATEILAIGWRLLLANKWIKFSAAAVDLTAVA